MERRYALSRDAILATIKGRLADGALTVEDLVKLTISESYWRGAIDATEAEVPQGTSATEEASQEAS